MLKPLTQRDNTLYLDLLTHLRSPLYRNAYALMLSGISSSALGMLYWMLAARTYSAAIVGLNSAAIAAMMLLSGMAQMSMNSALIRFLARAGGKSAFLILACYAIAGLLTVVTGVGYGLTVAAWTPALATHLQGWKPILLLPLRLVAGPFTSCKTVCWLVCAKRSGCQLKIRAAPCSKL